MKVINKITMRQLCLFLASCWLFHTVNGQAIGDTIVIYIDSKVEMSIAVEDYEFLKNSNKESAAIEQFSQAIAAISDQLFGKTADLINYNAGGSLTIRPGDPTNFWIQKDGALSNTGVRDKAIITGSDFVITLVASDISLIRQLSLSDCIEKVKKNLPPQTKFSKTLYYHCVDGEIQEQSDRHKMNPPIDHLEINIGAGAGLVRNTWVPDLSFGIGIGFNKKGAVRYPYASTNFLFDFNPEGGANVNTFVNLGYGFNIGQGSKNGNRLGVELGYLVSRQGDLFDENTMKFGFSWSPVKAVYVNPHLYFTSDFKNAFPGIRIGFGF